MPFYKFVLTVLLLGSGVSLIGSKDVCQCPATALKGDTLIFQGKVLDISSNHVASGLKITMGVSRIYQGETDPVTVVSTPWPGKACGFPFEKDSLYLVYAFRARSIKTDACQKTRKIILGELIPKELGEGHEPKRNLELIYSGIWTMIYVTLAGFILLIGVLFLKKRLKTHKS
jgi:hypothetical protein